MDGVQRLEEEINTRGFQLLPFVEKGIIENENYDSLEGIKGISEAGEIDTILDFQASRIDLSGNSIDKYKDVNGELIGITPEKYHYLIELANKILELDYFNKRCDYEYIENKVFDWVMNAYTNKSTGEVLVNYLYSHTSNDLKEFTYYFTLESIGIEQEFKVGNVRFFHFTDNDADSIFTKYQSIKDVKTEKDAFNKVINEYKDKILASCEVIAVNTKAKKIAKRKVELAVDTLKCFLINESLVNRNQIFDIDFRFSSNRYSSYFSQSFQGDINAYIGPTDNYGGLPIILRNDKYETIYKGGLNLFSNFIMADDGNEMYWEIVKLITQLGEITSTKNWHKRTVSLVSLFESIVIPPSNTKSLGQAYLKNNILRTVLPQKVIEEYKIIINRLYNVRDKYIHNRTELHIEYYDLQKMQKLALIFIAFLIGHNKTITNKNEFFAFFAINNAKE